jgi:hypothetical protein
MTEIEPAAGSRLIVLRPEEAAPVAYSDMDYAISVDTARDMLAAVPENTDRAYDRAWKQFAAWCVGEGRVPMPATPQTLTEYVHMLTAAGVLAPNTISQAIGAIRSRHARSGFSGQPDTPEPMKLLRAFRRDWAKAGGRLRQRTPILVPALRSMVETCDLQTATGARDRALLLIGFNMMGRRSEISALNISDIRSAGDNGIEVFIAVSKTDQEAKGVAVPVPFGQHEITCPVRAVRAWIALLAAKGIASGPLFRPIDRHGRIGGEPLAAGHAQPRLTGHGINEIVRRRAVLAALPTILVEPGSADTTDPEEESSPPQEASYGAHGLRSGAATTAYAAGAPVSEIAKHGRWNPKSPVVLGYIRAVDKWRNNPMKGIGL